MAVRIGFILYFMFVEGEDEIKISNNIGVDPKVVCHFSGKPSTTRLSVAKYLYSVCSLDPLTLAPAGVDLRFTFVQDDKFTQKIKHGSTAILLPKNM